MVCRGKYPILLPSKNYKAWREEQMWLIKKHVPKTPIERCEIAIEFYFPDKRATDLDNKAASILDLLRDSNIIKDDKCTVVSALLLYYCGVDKENPRAEVAIYNIDDV